MEDIISIISRSYKGYANYLWHEVTHPSWTNYFYWLIGVSLFFFVLELATPWRKEQARFRKDFWMDFFYMFFNFFLFTLIIYGAFSNVVVYFFTDLLAKMGITNLLAFKVMSWPIWAHLLIGLLVRDFVQWWIHRLLHKSDWLWKFHQVHHSVEEMGFAAHLRYHWMENIVYRTIEYIPLALLGIGLHDFFIIHIFTLAWGHYNHSNISISGRITGGILGALIGILVSQSLLDINIFSDASLTTSLLVIGGSILGGSFLLGPLMKYIFNSPEMHIWHHSYELPEERRYGINFGLTLAIWDYIFKTAYIPRDGRDIKLGFPGIEEFPNSFLDQAAVGWVDKKYTSDNFERVEK